MVMELNHRCSYGILLYRQAPSSARPTIQKLCTNKKPGDLAVQPGLLVFDQLIGYIKYFSRIARTLAGSYPLLSAKPASCEPMPHGWTHEDTAVRLAARRWSIVIDVLFVVMVVFVRLRRLLIGSLHRAKDRRDAQEPRNHRKG
jgi:hypothetical protein